MTKILLVDDEERMMELISLYLTPQGYKCIKAYSGSEALDHLKKVSVSLVLLDLMMTEMDGWETCKEIRKYYDVPIIMLTARNEKKGVVKGLKMGADDYITKPFDQNILLARIEALLRRTSLIKTGQLEFNGLVWDSQKYIVSYRRNEIFLTPKEFEMLGYFLKNQNKVFSREQLIDLIWGIDSYTGGRTIDSHIRNIRDKCRKAGFHIDHHLKTVWGVGYKWL